MSDKQKAGGETIQKSDSVRPLDAGQIRGSQPGDNRTALGNDKITNRGQTLQLSLNTADTVKPTRPPPKT